MHNKTVADLSRELESGKISSVELTGQFLDRIRAEDGKYNSFITVTEEQALAEAEAADKQRALDRHSVRPQGPVLHQWRAHHLWLENAGELRAALRRHRDRELPEGRCRVRGQDQHG